jgi:hypothetical protein
VIEEAGQPGPERSGYQRGEDVVSQTADARKEMRMRISDWNRIRRDLKRLRPSWASGWFSACSLFLGISVAAWLSLVSVYNVEEKADPPEWIVRTHMAIGSVSGGACLVCAIAGVLAYMSYRKRKGDLDKELDLFEEHYGAELKGKDGTTKTAKA